MPDTLSIIDTDSHLVEPPDLWTSRLSGRWGDAVPHVVHDERHNRDRWVVAGRKLTSVANWATAGWSEFPPSHPPSLEAADRAAYDPVARLARMDQDGIYAQVLYPNLLSFSSYAFLAIEDPALRLACVQAYNDYLVEFSEGAPDRFIALSVLPFWDVEASVRELVRAHELGHRGVLFIGKPHKLGLPRIEDDHWVPLFEAAQERQLSINFHVGFQEFTEEEFMAQMSRKVSRTEYAKVSAMSMIGNGETIADVLLSGLCVKYPNLKFVSVESGFGWLPYFVETLDWQWHNSGAAQAHPDREPPSYYFHRQVLGTFWFERVTVSRMIDLFADSVMFETDFPHPTSLSPGPCSSSDTPLAMAAAAFAGIPDDITRKVLHDNAAKLYHVKGR